MLPESAVNGAPAEELAALYFSVPERQGRKLKKLAEGEGLSPAGYSAKRIADAVAGYDENENYQISVELMDLRSRINEDFFIVLQFCKSPQADSAAYERAKEAAGDYAGCLSRIEVLTDMFCSGFGHFV